MKGQKIMQIEEACRSLSTIKTFFFVLSKAYNSLPQL